MLLIAQHLDGRFATLRTNRASLPTDYDGRLRRDGWGDRVRRHKSAPFDSKTARHMQ